MKKKIIAFFTSLLLMIPVFTVPVHAEETTLYWDGFFTALNGNDTITENLVTAYNTCTRWRFTINPSGHCIYSGNGNRKHVFYVWLIGTTDNSSLKSSIISTLANGSVRESCSTTSNMLSPTNLTSSDFHSESANVDGRTYYYVYYDFYNFQFPVRASSISYTYFGNDDPYNRLRLAMGWYDGLSDANYISPSEFYRANTGYGWDYNTITNWATATITTNVFFSEKVKTLMSGGIYDPSGNNVDINDPSGGVTPEGEGGEGEGGEGEGGGSSESSSSSSQQQQQQIAEGAVQVTNNSSIESDAVTVNVSDGITEETVQRLDQTLQNNNPYQTTFTTAVQTIDGFRQIGVKFAQTSEAFLDFLPSWVTDLLSLMFVLLFFFIVLRLLKVFHG